MTRREGSFLHRIFQAIEITSFSRLSRALDEVMENWSISISPGSVRGIPTLNSEAFNLLTLPLINTKHPSAHPPRLREKGFQTYR